MRLRVKQSVFVKLLSQLFDRAYSLGYDLTLGEAYRPGGVVVQTVAELDPDFQRYGGLGNWFTFNSIQPPGMELLASDAAGPATHEVFIDVIKV